MTSEQKDSENCQVQLFATLSHQRYKTENVRLHCIEKEDRQLEG